MLPPRVPRMRTRAHPRTRGVASVKRDPAKLTVVERRLAHLLRNPHLFPISAWSDFEELRDRAPEFAKLTHGHVRDVIEHGLREWMLGARWLGVGMTPWAGSARRDRIYFVKDKEMVRLFLERADVIEAHERCVVHHGLISDWYEEHEWMKTPFGDEVCRKCGALKGAPR